MAIATCNIKVNGCWVRAGEEYEPETVQVEMPIDSSNAEQAKEETKEETKATRKPRGTTRRKLK